MKFDVVIGNPPYQEDIVKDTSPKPLYNEFMDVAREVSGQYISFIIPARWYAGGKGLDKFRAYMLNDGHLKEIIDYPEGNSIFPEVDIAGGVMYFLYDKEYCGDCLVTNIYKGRLDTEMRKLNEFETFMRYNKAYDIVKKVQKQTDESILSKACNRNKFGYHTFERGDCLVDDPNALYKLVTSQGEFGLYKLNDGQDIAEKYKVMIGSLNNDRGQLSDHKKAKVITKARVLKPKEVCTDTYIVFGGFETELEAESFRSILYTRFARFLMWQLVSSIHITAPMFRLVPMQTLDRIYTDEILYEKYGLTSDEINYIKFMVEDYEYTRE